MPTSPVHLRVDLRTRVLSSNPQVFMIRPGASYHLYEPSLQAQAIAVDVPFLEFQPGLPLPDPYRAASMFERARVIRQWSMTSRARRGTRPAVDLERYSTFLSEQGPRATRTKLRNAANAVLYEIPERSLVYIPSSTLNGDAILAEMGAATDVTSVNGLGARTGIEYPARALMDALVVPMRDLPPQVTNAGHKQIVHNEFDGYAEKRLLRAYYGDYARQGQESVVEFLARSEVFDAKIVAQMTALAMSVEHFIETRSWVDPRTILFDRPDISGPQLHARINSRNGVAHVETSSSSPHILKVFLLVAACALPLQSSSTAMAEGHIQLENSTDANNTAIIEAAESTLIDYAAAGGAESILAIVENLRASVVATQGEIDGDVSETEN